MKMQKKYAVLKQNKQVKKSNKEKLNQKSTIITIISKNNKVNKKMIVSLSFIFVMIFIITLATSYAFFTTIARGKEFVVYTGNLAVGYTKKTDVIDVENLYPMSDTQGLATTPHEFTITNTGNIDARYQVRLELDKTVKDMIDIRYIKLSYQENGGEYSEPVVLSNLNSSLVFIKNVILPPKKNNSNTYGIKLWIDLGAPNDIQGKMFKARVVVDSIQNVEDGYVVDTVPIIYLNKDKNGNQDIHLKTNETYTELGVEKIVDDQEMFTPNQVNLSYEYYDGENLTTVSSVDTSKNGIYYITYSITDKSGNVSKRVRVVTVNNTDAVPSISLNGDASISLGERDYYKENGVTVTDDNKVITIGEVKTSTVGTYVVRYIVVDKNGNLNSVTRTVTITKSYQEGILNGADPVLTSNLIPVQIADNGTVTKASTSSSWYDYETKNWANAVVLKKETNYTNGQTIPEDNIKQYYVWIPRYRYQLWNVNEETKYPNGTSGPSAINIVFENNNTEVSNGTKNGEWLTHPAFTSFDTNGIWVGKFETSYDEESFTNSSVFASSNPNTSAVTTGTNILIKPNVRSLTNKDVSTFYTLGREVNSRLNSHMMKNSEWGAMAYLTYSLYGKCTNDGCEEVYINNVNTGYLPASSATYTGQWQYGASITGCSAFSSSADPVGSQNSCATNYAWNESNNKASTTGNISGIYDMSGGNREYVMGIIKDASGNPMSGRNERYNSGFNGTYGCPTCDSQSVLSKTNGIGFPSDPRYYDLYEANSTTLGDDTWYQYTNGHLGDATKEVAISKINNASGDRGLWFSDSAYFSTASHSWVNRGGNFNYGTGTGAFYFDRASGAANDNAGFRVVLAP